MKRIAVVHDWLPVYGGAERVLEQILAVYPQADLYTLVDDLSGEERRFLKGRVARTSFIQTLPWGKTKYRHFFPLMPLAIEQFDLSGYDLVLSSSYSFAKGVITGPNQLHVCYCHSPIRYAWDLQSQYLAEAGLSHGVRSWIVRALLHYIRMWDSRTSAGVDQFIANSHFVARRIWKTYRREAEVIYPPVDCEAFSVQKTKEDFYLTASRLVPYKKTSLIVEAFRAMPEKRLVVIGAGPELDSLRASAPPNVSVLGWQTGEVLRDYLQKARAFVFAAEEDFGILPVEAQACGTPVLAYGRGGATESVKPGETGIFFEEQSAAAICGAVRQFEEQAAGFDPLLLRRHAEQFSVARFRDELKRKVTAAWESVQGRRGTREACSPSTPATAQAAPEVAL